MSTLDTKKILLVEDEPTVVKMYRTFLEANGAKVDSTAKGIDAITMAGKKKYDIFILDRLLTGHMRGFDVLKRLRANDETKNTPVIFLTNLNLEDEKVELIDEYNVAGYYVKADTSLSKLLQVLSKL